MCFAIKYGDTMKKDWENGTLNFYENDEEVLLLHKNFWNKFFDIRKDISNYSKVISLFELKKKFLHVSVKDSGAVCSFKNLFEMIVEKELKKLNVEVNVMKKLNINFEKRINDSVDRSNFEDVVSSLKSYYLGKLFALATSKKSARIVLKSIILLRNELRADMFINLSELLKPVASEIDLVMADYQKHFEDREKKEMFGLPYKIYSLFSENKDSVR